MNSNLKKKYEKQQYRFVGNHSAVKVCKWTKESIRGRGVCYKEKFYGIKSHRCLQMTPSTSCNFNCVFCWRAHPEELGNKTKIITKVWDKPKEIIDGCVTKQRELLSGFKGYEDVDMKKWEEAQRPNQAAISLTGEPALYPDISGLISEFKRRSFTTFLVTNGSLPQRLENLAEPTNLYISLDAPNENFFKRIDRPLIKSAWSRVLDSLSLLQNFSSTTVIRTTLIKGLNMTGPEKYVKLFEKYKPKFVEMKAFMPVGYSQYRLSYSQMPLHKEVLEFSERIENSSSYSIKDQDKSSRVVLLGRD